MPDEAERKYSKPWVKLNLMVNPDTNEIHVASGDKEPGEGDQPYAGMKVLDRLIRVGGGEGKAVGS